MTSDKVKNIIILVILAGILIWRIDDISAWMKNEYTNLTYNIDNEVGPAIVGAKGEPLELIVRLVQVDDNNKPTGDADFYSGFAYESKDDSVLTVIVDKYIGHEFPVAYGMLMLYSKTFSILDTERPYRVCFRTIENIKYEGLGMSQSGGWITILGRGGIPVVENNQRLKYLGAIGRMIIKLPEAEKRILTLDDIKDSVSHVTEFERSIDK